MVVVREYRRASYSGQRVLAANPRSSAKFVDKNTDRHLVTAPQVTGEHATKSTKSELGYTIAIDPGGTTGIAMRLPDGNIRTTTTNTDTDLWLIFKEMPPAEVILEEWQYFDGIARPAGVYTASLVSSVRALCWYMGIPIHLRTPQSRRPCQRKAEEWLDLNKVKVVRGRTVKDYVVHEADALAHLFTWEGIINGAIKPNK